MGGCITPPKNKLLKINKQQTKNTKATESANDVTMDQPNTLKRIAADNLQKQRPRFRKMTGELFTRMYKIQENVGDSTRMEGAKYVSNYLDALGKVLRVVSFGVQNSMAASTKEPDLQKRIKIYSEILNLEVYEDQESNFLVLQQYYCGPFLHQIVRKNQGNQTNTQQIRRFLSQIYQIIDSFHQKGITIGNINIFSFRQASQFDSSVKMVKLNLLGSSDQAMGNAFRTQKSMDWESFAYIIESVCSPFPPVFIPHKLQYIQNSSQTAQHLLRGKKIKREQLDSLKFIIPNKDVINGYRFRNDILKLLKIRRKRVHHRGIYYSEDVMADGHKMSDEAMQRSQTNRVLQRINLYIKQINSQTEQPFMSYSPTHESMKKLKQIFVGREGDKKMEELREILLMLK